MELIFRAAARNYSLDDSSAIPTMINKLGNPPAKRPLKNGLISLSFDDGWRSVYDNAFPVLKRAGLAGTFYIVTGYLDSEQLPLYLNFDHVRELYDAQHEIGCHTVSHRHLPQEPDALVESEIRCSRHWLLKRGIDVKTFAYPFGEFDERIVTAVKGAGFIAARSIIDGFNNYSTNPLLLETKAVQVHTTVSDVRDWIQYAEKQRVWLILTFHQIDEEGRSWSTKPQTFVEIVKEVQESGLATVTVAEGAEWVYAA